MNNASSQNFYFGDSYTLAPDPILDMARHAALARNTGHEVIDVSVGYMYDDKGHVWVPSAIVSAFAELALEKPSYIEVSPGYLSPSGDDELLGYRQFLEEAAAIMFPATAKEMFAKRNLAVSGTPGGTGAVRLFADAVAANISNPKILISAPTWSNYQAIFDKRGFSIIECSHVKNGQYNLQAHLTEIKNAPLGTIVLFQLGKTHNPTGLNPKTEKEWKTLAQAMEGKKAFFDAPYVGFGESIEEDTLALRTFMEKGIPLAVALSFAKNTGLYKERPGALYIVTNNPDEQRTIQRIINACARASFSSPPGLGEIIIGKMLANPRLKEQWRKDLSMTRTTLSNRRNLLSKALPQFAKLILETAGLFITLPIPPEMNSELKKEYIFMVGERINIGGLFEKDIPRFANALKFSLQRKK